MNAQNLNAAPEKDEAPKGAKERLYDKLPVTKRMMDIICALLLGAIALTVILALTT